MSNKIYQIMDIFVDTKTRQLFRHGKPIPISSRAFDILKCLIENQGAIVEKNHILTNVWPDSFVEENNLPVHISALRRVLGEQRGEHRFIKTISGRGYCFIAPVSEVVKSPSASPILSIAPTGKPDSDEPVSVAILPFTFEPDSPDLEFQALRLTRGIIDDLSQIFGLRVFAYAAVRQYQNSDRDLYETAFVLGADHIVTGNIAECKTGAEISVELVDVSDKTRLWGKQQPFESDDIVRTEISRSIAETLKVRLTESNRSDFARQQDLSHEAQKLYFRGVAVMESRSIVKNRKETLMQAVRFFQQAISIEPNYALAYTGIGMVYLTLHNFTLCTPEEAYAEAKKALKMALEIDERTSQAHVLKASIETMIDRNLDESNRALDRAIELNPNNPDAYHWKGLNLLCLGRFEESLAMEIKATQFDPISLRFSGQLMRIHYYAGNYRKVIVQAEELLEFNENYLDALLFLALCNARLGLKNESLEFINRVFELRPDAENMLTKAHILAMTGDKLLAEQIMTDAQTRYSDDDIDYCLLASIHSEIGNVDTAFAMLEKAIERGSTQLCMSKIDQSFENLRNDPRFNRVLNRLNLGSESKL